MQPASDPWSALQEGISLPAEVLQGLAHQWAGRRLKCDHDAIVEFDYIRFDADGKPMTKDLAKALVEHLMHYALGEFAHPRLPSQTNRIQQDAKEFLRAHPTSGEAGEILLYALLEAFRGAPQVISKLNLKTNSKDEVKGSDGVHIAKSPDGQIDLYFGEAKLYKSTKAAVRDAMKSLKKFYDTDAQGHEIRLIQSHVRKYPKEVRDAILAYCRRDDAAKTFRHNHAVLIGFEWEDYDALVKAAPKEIEREFRILYEKHHEDLCTKVAEAAATYTTKKLRLEFFFLPFTQVQEFRKMFYGAAGVPLPPARAAEQEED